MQPIPTPPPGLCEPLSPIMPATLSPQEFARLPQEMQDYVRERRYEYEEDWDIPHEPLEDAELEAQFLFALAYSLDDDDPEVFRQCQQERWKFMQDYWQRQCATKGKGKKNKRSGKGARRGQTSPDATQTHPRRSRAPNRTAN